MKKARESKKSITLIKKANDLIEARYMFDIWETRFFLSVLSQIHRDDSEFKVYRIKYKDVVKTFGLKSNSSYDYLRQAAKNIMDRKVAISYEVGGVVRETLYHIIRKVDYLKEGEGRKRLESHEYIDVTVEQEMKPLLLQLQKNFTAYDLRNVIRLGVYPIRIYELLKQYESIGKRTLQVEEMKKMFELKHEYPRFSNFYQKIIKPAIDEINDFTDLKITNIEKIKEDRQVVALQFEFKRKSSEEIAIAHSYESKKKTPNLFSDFDDSTALQEVEDTEVTEIVEVNEVQTPNEKDRLFMEYQQVVLSSFGVTPTVFLNALEEKSEANLQRAIRITEQVQKEGNIKNLAGFFIEALRQNYTNEKEEKEQIKREKWQKNQEIESELTLLIEQREQIINDKIRQLTTENPSITQQLIQEIEGHSYLKIFIQGKIARIGRELNIDDYRQDSELRMLVKQNFIDTYKDEFQTLTGEIDIKISLLEKQLVGLDR
jgi:plasmid replication initiation protein